MVFVIVQASRVKKGQREAVLFTMQVHNVTTTNNMARYLGAFGMESAFFVGCMYQEYTEILAQSGGILTSSTATGNSLSFLAGRQVCTALS